MNLVRRIKLTRIPYGELEVGDEYIFTMSRIRRPYVFDDTHHELEDATCEVMVLDTTKYPPESVTWDVMGISEDDVFVSSMGDVLFNDALSFDESEIETIYE